MGAVYLVRDRLMNRRVALKRVHLPTAKESTPQLAASIGVAVEPTLADIVSLPTVMGDSAEGARHQAEPVVVMNRGSINRSRLQALRVALANEFRTLASLRHPNIVSGSLAPEVLQGHPVTPQADLYSFGIVAFELLTNRPLWPSETATSLVSAALSSEPSFDDANLPKPLQTVLRRLLARDPAQRFATAEETASALAAAVAIAQPLESGELSDCVCMGWLTARD